MMSEKKVANLKGTAGTADDGGGGGVVSINPALLHHVNAAAISDQLLFFAA